MLAGSFQTRAGCPTRGRAIGQCVCHYSSYRYSTGSICMNTAGMGICISRIQPNSLTLYDTRAHPCAWIRADTDYDYDILQVHVVIPLATRVRNGYAIPLGYAEFSV